MTKYLLSAALLAMMSLSACTVGQPSGAAAAAQERDMTVGLVQREIREGMSDASVVEALGSPNIVTTRDDGGQRWVYDRIASEASYKESSSGFFLILGGVSNRSASAATSQRTLTVIIDFDKGNKVSAVKYHQTKF